VETTVASTVVAIVLAAITVGGILMQRTFAGSDLSLKANADQLRVLDYFVTDMRQALTATVSNGGQQLTLTIPPYLNSDTGQPVIPTVIGTATGATVDYGSAASPTTVTYFPANVPTPPSTTYTYQANGAYIIRQVGNTQTVISRDCTSLQMRFTDGKNLLPPNPAIVQASINYAPRYNFSNQSGARTGTTVYATSTFRNPRRN
jgi:hypothetical protein